jgi:hypothetical protein
MEDFAAFVSKNSYQHCLFYLVGTDIIDLANLNGQTFSECVLFVNKILTGFSGWNKKMKRMTKIILTLKANRAYHDLMNVI